MEIFTSTATILTDFVQRNGTTSFLLYNEFERKFYPHEELKQDAAWKLLLETQNTSTCEKVQESLVVACKEALPSCHVLWIRASRSAGDSGDLLLHIYVQQ